MSINRTLFLHAGFHKTGSSALQNYLHHNKNKLESAGIAYRHSPEHPFGHAGAGNGERLFRIINSNSDEEIQHIIASYFGEHDNALCSNEDFSLWSDFEWGALNRICHQMEISLKVIIFIRNPVPYFLSQYNQWVKGGSEYRSLKEWIEIGHPYSDVLRVIAKTFSPSDIRVLHYETERSRLDQAFMEQLGLDVSGFNHEPLKKKVNRSLTEFELSLARKANAIFSEIGFPSIQSLLAYSLSEVWLSTYPDLGHKRCASDDIRSLIEARYRSDVEWVNQSFFEGNEVVSFTERQAADPQDISDAQKMDILQASFLWAVSKIVDIYKYGGDEIVAQHVTTARKKAQDCPRPEHGIPESFDPFFYLMRYPDLLRAGGDPYQHFLSSGLAEGRFYSWRQDGL